MYMQFVNKLNWPLFAFITVTAKSLVVPLNAFDVCLIVPVVSLMAYQMYIQNIKIKPYQEKFDAELASVRKELDDRMFAQAKALAEQIKLMDSKVTSISTKEQIKNVSPGERRYF
jgi:hypothetical protein